MTNTRPQAHPAQPQPQPQPQPAQPSQPAQPRPIPPLPPRAVRIGSPASGGERDDALSGTVSPSGSGQDARHRGWYWHWNTLITQYAPLLGLKGVGLLNSYTVWTDRREGSPHQGFAFPAQESEARFYGEGREELITLNKILVALDLIEIHKEMVVRQDERGRRWRVPHNFYRVKDPKNGLVLALPAMLRLLELAQRDRNVFRQIRHIFGPQFTAIDRTNLWHSLLPELRALPLWAELEARAARERRTPRTATVTPGATATATADDQTTAPTVTPHHSTFVADGDIAPLTSEDLDYNGRTNPTLAAATAAQPDDNDAPAAVIIAHRADNPARVRLSAPVAQAPAGSARHNAFAAVPVSPPTDPAVSDDEGSADNEGMMSVEGGMHPSVRPNDRMYYQPGETKEDTTETSSTTSRARAEAQMRADARPDTETVRMLRASSPPAPPVAPARAAPLASPPPPRRDSASPLRPSVSDLFAALAEQRDISPPAPDQSLPDRVGGDAPDAANAADDLDDLDDANAAGDVRARTQPLPPEPGEGAIVVRAVDVTDGRVIGADERAMIADIEAALTMTNSRPPSDMEMSLYWQIARDCDAAARSQPGPGSGFGWVLAAITEAVNSSGTGRLAPKYVARICERWTTDGYMHDGRAAAASDVPPPSPPRWLLTAARDPDAPDVPDAPPALPVPSVAGPPPNAADMARMWPSVRRRLEGVLPADALGQRWFTGSRVVAVEGSRVRVEAPDAESARTLANYRGLISRRLSDVLGWSAEAVFEAAPPTPPLPPPPSPSPSEPADPDSSSPLPTTTATTTATITTAATTATTATEATAQSDAPPASSASPAADDADDAGATPRMSTQVYSFASPDEPAPLPARSIGVTVPAPDAPWDWPATGTTGPAAHGETGPKRLISLLPRRESPAPTTPPIAPASSALPAPPAALMLVPSVPTFAVGSDGETNAEVWARALAYLQPQMNAATYQVWIEPTALIAQDPDGVYIVGTRNRVQRERLERQHTADLTTALAAALKQEAQEVRIRIAVIGA